MNIVYRCVMQQDELNYLRRVLDDPEGVYNLLLNEKKALQEEVRHLASTSKIASNQLLKSEIYYLKSENEALKAKTMSLSELTRSRSAGAQDSSPTDEVARLRAELQLKDRLLAQMGERLGVYDKQLREAVTQLKKLEAVARERDALRIRLENVVSGHTRVNYLERYLIDAQEQILALEEMLGRARRERFVTMVSKM